MSQIPSDRPLQGIHEFGMQPIGALPFTTYPNSENIHPPIKKEPVRVVEPSTRTDVNLTSLREWHEKKAYWSAILDDERLQRYFNEQDRLNAPRSSNIDISV